MTDRRLSRAVGDIARRLALWTLDGPAMTWLAQEVRDQLDAGFVGAYQPALTDAGWNVDSMIGAGGKAPLHIRAFHECVARLADPDRFLGYDPYWVDPAQRNRSLSLRELPRGVVAEQNETVLRDVGAGGHDQIRVLVCDGPRILTWFGATRLEPFTPRERVFFMHLVPLLQRRMRLERDLRPGATRAAALDALVETIGRAAFVVGPRQSIEAANARATEWLERDPRAVRAAIRDSLQASPDAAPFAIVPLSLHGCPDHVLAIEKERRPTLAERVSKAGRRWGLTPRQARVLELLVDGATNKEIAALLECATVTVENHVTELYRRSGTRSRAALVRSLFLLE